MGLPDVVVPITTERLVLRPFTADDADDHYAYWHLPEVAAYVPWEPGTRDEALEKLQARIRQGHPSDDDPGLALAIDLDGRVLGEILLMWGEREHQQGEIGFALHPDGQGRGLAFEAAHAMLGVGFEVVGFRRIIGRCDAENTASARLMERLGMRREAHLRENEFFKGRWSDEFDYAMLAWEWASQQGQ